MKKSILPLLIGLLMISINAIGQIIDYNTGPSSSTIKCDFTNGFKIDITNAPQPLTTPIVIKDAGTINLTINQSALTNNYAQALKTVNGVSAIELQITGGKIGPPFSTGNIQQPLTINFNGKVLIIKPAPPVINQPTNTSSVNSSSSNSTGTSISAGYTPGLVYYDVIQLKKLLDAGNGRDILSVLTAYNVPLTSVKDNPYLKDVFGPLLDSSGVQSGNSLSLSNALSFAGDLDVTNLADGIAKFLVQRSKEELNVAFFTKFKQFTTNYPEIKLLFPSTYGVLGDINSYQYAAMLPALRASFQKDLNALCGNMIKLHKLTVSPNATQATKDRVKLIVDFLNNHVAGRSIIGGLVLTNSLINGNNIAVAINDLAIDSVCTVSDTSKFYNISGGIQLVNLVSQSLISKDEGNIWVTRNQLMALLNDPVTLNIYLGLLYAKDAQNSTHVTFRIAGADHSLQEYFNKLEPEMQNATAIFARFKSNLQQVANAIDNVNNNIKTIQSLQKQNASTSILAYANYATSVTNVITQTVNLLPDNTANNGLFDFTLIKKDFAVFTNVLNDAVNCSYDIKSQNYGSLVLHTSDILSQILTNCKDSSAIKNSYLKYGTFMANIVQAQNSDEVNAAIDAAVLPVGSSSIKRNTIFNVALNAYIGPYIGSEKIHGFDKHGVTSYGLTAPVGVSFSCGNVPFKGWSLSAFVPLIDVGAIASYRAGNNTTIVGTDTLKTSNIPEVKLKNIVSPGLFLSVGIPNSPISISGGYQLAPTLRSITTVNSQNQVLDPNTSGVANQYATKMYSRWSISIVVDIPLLNFYTSSK